MAVRHSETTQTQQDSSATSQPSDFVRSSDQATQNYLTALMREQGTPIGAVPPDVAQLAQQTVGNRATADLLEPPTDETEATDAETADTEDDRVLGEEREEDEEEDELLPDPDQPAPADPAAEPDQEDEEAHADDEPPPHQDASAQTQPSAPASSRSADIHGTPGAGGGTVVVPSGGGAAAVVNAATQTAANMPQPASSVPAPASTPPSHPPRRRRTRRQIAGPPPVPMADPQFAPLPDPLQPAMQRIEEIAARRLRQRQMPEVPLSPGENRVDVPEHEVTREDIRMITMGDEAMDRAGLSQSGGVPTQEERDRGEPAGTTRNRLLQMRNQLLHPEAPAAGEEGQSTTTPEAPAHEAAAPHQDAEQADAEAVAPGVFNVQPVRLPPEDMTVAEQEMFTAALATLKARGREGSKEILNQIKKDMPEYPGGVLIRDDEPALYNLGMNLLPDLQHDMDSKVDGIAEVLGTAGSVLDRAVTERRTALETEAHSQTNNIQESARLDLLNVENTAQARLDDAAAARAQATDAQHRARSVGNGPQVGFRQTAESAIRQIQTKVSEAIARFRLEKQEMHTHLDSAKARWLSAIRLAALADQFDAQRERGLQPSATLPLTISLADRRAILRVISAAQQWKTRQESFINGHVQKMKMAVDTEIGHNIDDVQKSGAEAFRSLRDWGNTQDQAVDGWWQSKVRDLQTWADNATDTANTWAQTESRLARLQLQLGAQRAHSRILHQIQQDEAENEAYEKLTEGQKRNFIARNILNSNHLLMQVGAPLESAEIEAKKDSISQNVEGQLFALPRSEWHALDSAAKAKNPDFSALKRAGKIREAGYDDNLGTDEDTIFEQLSGLRRIELLAVTACYNDTRHSDNALYNDLDGELSGDEWSRAQDLMGGHQGSAAAEAIHDAVFGPGTSEEQIYAVLEQLNELPEAERRQALIEADETYRKRYGEGLSERLNEDLSGSEAGRALALFAGNLRAAQAHQMNEALESHDADAAAGVYERIRSDEMKAARSNDALLTPIEYEAAVVQRNGELEDQFQQYYGNVTNYHWGNGSALENAVGYQFAFDEGSRHRLQGFQAGDLIGVSAGHMQGERTSTYADDEVMGNIVTAQYARAADVVELEQGPERRMAVQRRVDDEIRRRENTPNRMTAEEIKNYRMQLDREMNTDMANAAFDRAHYNVDALDTRLQDRYGITLNDMITNTMSDNVFGDGGDLSNARERIAIMRRNANDSGAPDNRRLDWAYTRLRHSIEGAGTDVDDLRSTMGGLTKGEIEQLNQRWLTDHPNETLRSAIQTDTSGRDEDDLVDAYDHGMPETVSEQVDQLRRRLHRDEESVGFWGASQSEDQSRQSHKELARLEAMATRMRDPNLTPEQRQSITASFDEQRSRSENAIQVQRDRVDSYADVVTTVVGYVVSAVVIAAGAVLTVVSGGTLSPALAAAIAISGSILGTVTGIAAKAAIKGGAYGMEDFGVDVAVGLVDLAVTLATEGMLKGAALFRNLKSMFSGVKEEIKTISRQVLRKGMEAAAEQTARSAVHGGLEAGVHQATRGAVREVGEGGTKKGLLETGREYLRGQAVDAAIAIPTVLTANILNEENWRHGNVAANVLRGSWEASLQNLRDGVIMGAGGHLAHHGAKALIPVHPLSTPQIHERNIRHWLHDHPGATPGEYARYVESYAAQHSDHADAMHTAQREARRALLSEIPPRERGAVADVPIIHVNDTQFRHFNNGNFGNAMAHVHEGQAMIIIREGAPASSIAEIGPSLRDIVAPGTRGRTANPAESLPPRLRNRVEVEVVNDPSFGADEVRTVPQRDRDGNIIGVALQVGPNARAIDIQLHVGTVDAMRRYAGLAGRIREFMGRVGRRLGMDIIDPRHTGHWEASLEIAKLPRIIEERMMRLSESGLDPRRRALVMEEIANLEGQFMHEAERLELGDAAEARGYVASKPQGDHDTVTHQSETSAANDAGPAMTEAEKKARQRDIAREIRQYQAREIELRQQLDEAQGSDHSTAQNRIRNQRESYAAAMRKLRQHLPAELHPRIDFLDTHLPWPPMVAANHHDIASHPAFAEALAKLGKVDQDTITRIGGYQEIIAAHHRRREYTEAETRQIQENIAQLRDEYQEIGGRYNMGVERHPDLPDPRAPVGYAPELAFEKTIRERLASMPELANELIEAIGERLDKGYSEAFEKLAEREDLPGLLRNPERETIPTLEERFQNIVNHIQGYRAELALASDIAGGIGVIEGLPGDGSDHVVIDYGDKIGENHADVISVDSQGNVFLWDSKYHHSANRGGNSPTFTSDTTRAAAVADALHILQTRDLPNLSPEARQKAIENLDSPTPTYFAVTSHTGESLANFRHFVLEFGVSGDGS